MFIPPARRHRQSQRWCYRALALGFAWIVALPVGSALALEPPAQAAQPQTYFFLVFNSPVRGREAEYNLWYNHQHAPDVVSVPGFVSAQRYELNAIQLRAVALKKPKYLVLYEIRTDDLPAVIAEVKRRLSTGQTKISPALDPASGEMYLYRQFRPTVPGAGGQPVNAKPGGLRHYLQVVFGDAAAGQDQAFNTWYDQDHEPSLLAGAGFVSARRGLISETQMVPIPDPSKYLALFEIRTSDLAAVFSQKFQGSEPPPAFDRARTFGYTYRAIGPKILGDAVRAQRSRAHRSTATP